MKDGKRGAEGMNQKKVAEGLKAPLVIEHQSECVCVCLRVLLVCAPFSCSTAGSFSRDCRKRGSNLLLLQYRSHIIIIIHSMTFSMLYVLII